MNYSVAVVRGLVAAAILTFASVAPAVASFVDSGATFGGIQDGVLAWGDIDSDGDLDLLVSGSDAFGPRTELYRNDDGFFAGISGISIGLKRLTNSSADWGDYDGDGDLDLIFSGATEGLLPFTDVYRNDGGTFTDIAAGMLGVENGSVAWGDYDNDGDLDALVTGQALHSQWIANIYRNDSGAFVEISAGMIGVSHGSLAWGDYDGDGDLDVVMTGESPTVPATSLYRNDDGTFVYVPSIMSSSYAVGFSSVAWGDYDNDGDLDIVLTGQKGSLDGVTRVFRNDAGIFSDAGALGLPQLARSSVALGDYDNDGSLDVLIAGDGVTGPLAAVYRYDGSSFSVVGAGLTGVQAGDVAWGDFDGDGDLDAVVAGSFANDEVSTKLYVNQTSTANTRPVPPTNLDAVWSGATVTFSWDASVDGQTPSDGLTYNLTVGTAPGASDVFASQSDVGTGYRRVPRLGSQNHATSWTLVSPPQVPLHWSVQAIDNGLAGSEFATEQVIAPEFTDTGADLVGVVDGATVWADYDRDGDLDLLVTGIAASEPSTELYRNNAGVFTAVQTNLADLRSSSAAWGDYDNNGTLDVVISGMAFGDLRRTTLYRNFGSFLPFDAGFVGLSGSCVEWGDYDNDGDLDLIVAGWATTGRRLTRLYRNDQEDVFTAVDAGFTDISDGAVAWGDYDDDGDLDLLLCGNSSDGDVCKLYRNDSGVFVDLPSALGTAASRFASVAWGDLDSDGDLDAVIAGRVGVEGRTWIFRNDAGAFVDIGANLVGVWRGSVSCGDYDNDGDLDVLVAGQSDESAASAVTRVYRNDAGVFTDAEALLPGVGYAAAAWGDYDNDGDLDIAFSGAPSGGTKISKIYENQTTTPNTAPAAPTNLHIAWSGTSVTFNWDQAYDEETPASALTYNLRVGSAAGSSDIFSPHSNAATGFRRVPRMGAQNHRTSWTLELPERIDLYWSVQTVDGCLKGSPFAAEAGRPTAVDDNPSKPIAFFLHQSQPNPFNPKTLIRFDLASSGPVRLAIFDVAGRLVRTLLREPRNSGSHEVTWNGRDDDGTRVASGVYICRLEAQGLVQSQRLTLLK